MPRAKLTDAEREARRRERSKHSFSAAAYRHYDAEQEGYGSPEEWIRAAEGMAGGQGRFERIEGAKSPEAINGDLLLLNLHQMPESKPELLRAFRPAAMKAHPDHGGSNEAIRAVLEAYQRLLALIHATGNAATSNAARR